MPTFLQHIFHATECHFFFVRKATVDLLQNRISWLFCWQSIMCSSPYVTENCGNWNRICKPASTTCFWCMSCNFLPNNCRSWRCNHLKWCVVVSGRSELDRKWHHLQHLCKSGVWNFCQKDESLELLSPFFKRFSQSEVPRKQWNHSRKEENQLINWSSNKPCVYFLQHWGDECMNVSTIRKISLWDYIWL